MAAAEEEEAAVVDVTGKTTVIIVVVVEGVVEDEEGAVVVGMVAVTTGSDETIAITTGVEVEETMTKAMIGEVVAEAMIIGSTIGVVIHHMADLPLGLVGLLLLTAVLLQLHPTVHHLLLSL